MKRINVNDINKINAKKNKAINSYPVNRDCAQYRSRYPELRDSALGKFDMNLRFYSNELKSSPNPGGTIDEILSKWPADHELLERHHGYIQWLFPLRVQGLNSRLHRLQEHEIEAMQSSRIIKMRMLNAYRMMLNFYGLRLVDHETGKLAREPNFDERLTHLMRHPHNLLRITRIVRSLGEIGWTNLQRPLVEVFVDLLLEKNQLEKILKKSMRSNEMESSIRLLRNSCTDYWVNSILNDSDWLAMQTRAIALIQ